MCKYKVFDKMNKAIAFSIKNTKPFDLVPLSNIKLNTI